MEYLGVDTPRRSLVEVPVAQKMQQDQYVSVAVETPRRPILEVSIAHMMPQDKNVSVVVDIPRRIMLRGVSGPQDATGSGVGRRVGAET